MLFRKVSRIHIPYWKSLLSFSHDILSHCNLLCSAASFSLLCEMIASASLGWYWSHGFWFLIIVAELQPRPRTWPQAHHDRWVGCVGEAQRRPDGHQEAHREDGRGEFSAFSSTQCWLYPLGSDVITWEGKGWIICCYHHHLDTLNATQVLLLLAKWLV